MAFDRVMVFSNTDTPICDIPPELIFGATRTEVVNGEHKLAITTTYKLAIGNRLLTQDHTGKWREWVINGIDEQHQNGARPMGTYTGVWSLQYDLTGVQCDKMPGVQSPVSARNALIAAISGTARWTVGTVNVTSTGGASMWQRSAWEALKVLIETWGGEIDATITVGRSGVTARKVDLLQHVGATNVTRRFEYGADLTAIRRKVADGPLYCRVIPLGAGNADGTSQSDGRRRVTIASVNGGVEWLQNDNMVTLARVPDGSGGWEYPTRFVIYDGITSPAELKAKATADLEAQTVPAVTYTASVAQYGEAGVDVTGVNVGDDVHVVDGAFGDEGLRLSARVTKLVTDELNPELSTVTLGSLAATIANNIGAINKQVSALSNYTSRTQTTMADFMSNLLEEINGRVNANGGWSYLIPGRGLVTYDVEIEDLTDDSAASQVTEIRGGTLRFANTRDQAGNWEYKTVLVSGHIATELVTAGHITAGYIGDPNGDYWDLDNHTLRITGGTSIAGTTAQTLVNTANTALTEINSLDQTEIFNRLTNDGEEQGIFLDDGKLYLNADYMNAGAIGNVSSGNYWNIETGELRMASTAQLGDTTVAGALADIATARDTANDDNLIPFTARMDKVYGWNRGPGWLSGKENSYIEAYSDTLDWNHRIVSPEIPLADLWGRELTFSVDGKSASADALVHIDVSIYHAGQSSRFAWYSPGDFTFGSASYSRPSKTFTISGSTAWSYASWTTTADQTFSTGTDKARVVLSLRTLDQRVNLNRWMLQPGDTATTWRPSATDVTSSVDDENLLPYTENVDEAHGWRPRNATLNGVTGMTIAANTSGTLDWSHGVDAPMIPLSVIWGKQVTFSGFFKSTVENTSVLAYVELWRPGASVRHAWRQIGTIYPSTTSMTRYSCTIIPDADTPWSYTSQSDTTIDWQKDKARFFVVVRTLNATVTSNRWKLQYGYHATDWKPSSADASATTVLNTLTQTDVFNRLTNNGALQGLYMSGGNLYVNASYIRTGNLAAGLITSGKLTSANGQSYFDLDNNLIRLGTSSTNYTTIDATGQIKSANSSGSYYGTVSAGANASGMLGQMHYLTWGGYVYAAIRGFAGTENNTTNVAVEIIILKYSVRKTIAAFYALSDAEKWNLFNLVDNRAARLRLSPYMGVISGNGWQMSLVDGMFSISTQSWYYNITVNGPTFQKR